MLSIGNSEARDRGKQDVTNFKSENYDSSILDKSQTKHEVIDGKDNISKDELVRLKESIIHDIMTTIKRIGGTQLFVDLKYDTTGCLNYSFGTNSSNIMMKGEVNLSDCIASSSMTQISSNKFSAREESSRCIRIKNLSNNSFILYGNVSGYEDFLMKHDGTLSRFSPEGEGWIFPINKESKIREFFSIPFENKTLTLKDYIYYFNSLNVSTRLGNVSPHKAIMLLSVMDLVAKNKITSNRIEFSLDLENSFKQNWKTYVPKDSCFRANAYIPYGYMKSEPFWRLVSKKDGESVIDKLNKVITCSPSTIEKYKIYAEIDDNLFKLMNDTESRNRLRETLIQKYLHISSSKQKP